MYNYIAFENNEGGVSIVVPSPNWNGSAEVLAMSCVPVGADFEIVDASTVPKGREFCPTLF